MRYDIYISLGAKGLMGKNAEKVVAEYLKTNFRNLSEGTEENARTLL